MSRHSLPSCVSVPSVLPRTQAADPWITLHHFNQEKEK